MLKKLVDACSRNFLSYLCHLFHTFEHSLCSLFGVPIATLQFAGQALCLVVKPHGSAKSLLSWLGRGLQTCRDRMAAVIMFA
jgi:hypothetical protein